MHFPLRIAVGAVSLLAACSTVTTATSPASPAPPASTAGPTTPSPSTSAAPPPSTVTTAPSPAPSLPAGIPPWFEDDVPAGDVPAAALIPLRATVTGTWFGSTASGETIVVAWQAPGDDPFRAGRGVAAWRRFDDDGAPWRPVWGRAFRPADGVLGIEAVTGDVTDDGSDEVVVFAATGGTGTCGSFEVIDLAHGEAVYDLPDVCDTRLDPDVRIPGLIQTEAVFEPGDPHCCPSAVRETTLVWDGQDWTEASVETTQL